MDNQLMLDPASRRRWLLTKALEIAPFGGALALAQAAEDFISWTGARTGDRTSPGVVTAPTSRAGLEAEATPLNSLSVLAVGGNQPPGENDPPLMTAEAIVGLSSLASIREIILYLRQSGEVFAEHETADELLARANLKRIEQALPPFALLPTSLPKVVRQDKPEKVTLPRPLSVQTRADWAGLVVTSPAE